MDRLGVIAGNLAPTLFQLLEFALSSNEWRPCRRRNGFQPGRNIAARHDPIKRALTRQAFQNSSRQALRFKVAVDEPPCGFRNQQFAGMRLLLYAEGEIRRLSYGQLLLV